MDICVMPKSRWVPKISIPIKEEAYISAWVSVVVCRLPMKNRNEQYTAKACSISISPPLNYVKSTNEW